MLKVGELAPDFTLTADDGAQFTLSSLRGRRVFLWFFPEADTPGCSLEGRGLRDHREYFDQSAIEVIGISFDSVADNAAFGRKYNFGFRLLSDTTHEVALAFGACDEPQGKTSRTHQLSYRRRRANRTRLRQGRSARPRGAGPCRAARRIALRFASRLLASRHVSSHFAQLIDETAVPMACPLHTCRP